MLKFVAQAAGMLLLVVGPVAGIDSACTTSLSDGGSLTTYYDEPNEKIVVQATLPDSSYAGWGWGSAMANTEMLIFSANGDTSSVTAYKGR